VTPQRFEDLAQAYGADRRRWPSHEQGPAEALCQAQPDLTADLLRQAAELDQILDQLEVPSPSMALRDRVLAAAPKPRRPLLEGRFRGWRQWGLGLAAAGIAGILVGASSVSLMMADLPLDMTVATALEGATSYSETLSMAAEEPS
jgi:hypothetical protein